MAEKDFFAGMRQNQAMEFLHINQIKYIYLPKIYGINLDGSNLRNIYENSEVTIYEVAE